jgi:sulfur relay (sulfurtransferase) complex TusBCD TusD component (DsrE family)
LPFWPGAIKSAGSPVSRLQPQDRRGHPVFPNVFDKSQGYRTKRFLLILNREIKRKIAMPRLTALVFAILMAVTVSIPLASAETDKTAGLFVNLTTDDTWSAAKAISFAHQRVLKGGHKPVAIWLNVRGVYLADKKRPSHVHGLMRPQNVSIQDMLAAFMADGGRVIMCAACSKAAGLTLEDYIKGVEMGSWPLVESLLFDPKVKTLSW